MPQSGWGYEYCGNVTAVMLSCLHLGLCNDLAHRLPIFVYFDT
jgi:hypothetical protein